jgi:hypothetical protein
MSEARTHDQIINEAGGPLAVARCLGYPRGRVQQWTMNGIPRRYRKGCAAKGIAQADELEVHAPIDGRLKQLVVQPVADGPAGAGPTPTDDPAHSAQQGPPAVQPGNRRLDNPGTLYRFQDETAR